MSRGNSNDNDASSDSTNEVWEFDRRRALQLGGASIAGLGFLGGGAGVVSAETDCANGPFEASYTGGSVTFSEIPSPEGPSAQANATENQTRTFPVSNEKLTDAERAAIKRRGKPANAQRANASKPASKRPEETDGNGLRIGAEYDGINAEGTRGGVPSDSQIATGTEYNLHAVNQQVAMFEKGSGDQALKVRLEDIWDPVIPVPPDGGFVGDGPFVFDPRARYDRNEDRYILAAVQSVQGIDEDGSIISNEDIEEHANGPGFGEEEGDGDDGDDDPDPAPPNQRDPRGYLLVAASATSDPTGKWYVYRFPPEDADGPDNAGLVDYPELGFDTDAVHLTENFFANDPDRPVRPSLSVVNKAQLYSGESITVNHFVRLDNPNDEYQDFTTQPAEQPFSGGSDGTHYFMNTVFPNSMDAPLATTLTQWELTDPLDDPTLNCFVVEVDPYASPPDADQPDSDANIDTIGRRLMNLDYNDETGTLWTAHAVPISWDGFTVIAAIRWYEIDPRSRSLVQSGTYGDPSASYFMPNISSDGDSTVIVHNVSGSNTFPEMDAAGRTDGFPKNELQDAIVVEEGKSRYDYGEGTATKRWGDYNGISVDPVTGHFWGVSQYSPDINIDPARERRDPYHTRIAELSFGGDAKTETNVLTIRGTGSRAEYTFSVTSNLEKSTANGANVNGNDKVRRGYVGNGVVGTGSDSYTFDGTLETIDVDGDADVSLNGNRVTDDEITDMPDNAVEVEGTGSRAEYVLASTGEGGSLQKLTANDANLNANDTVFKTTANGVVGTARDAYGFDGSLDALGIDGDANVYVNGVATDPGSQQDHVLTIVGTGERATYDFTVGGDLAKSTANFANLNRNDGVSGTSASGVVGSASDSYVYDGDISAFSVDGDATVYVDGERIDQGNVANRA